MHSLEVVSLKEESKMSTTKRTKKEIVVILIEKLDEIQEELADLSKKQDALHRRMGMIKELLGKVMEEPDMELGSKDLKMDDNVSVLTDDDNESMDEDEIKELEYDGEVYKLGEKVKLYDSKKKKWTKQTGTLKKFCTEMAFIKIKGNKETRRKYGNFRKV